MSMSKKWLFPGAIKLWKNLCSGVKLKYFYNPIQNKYYKNRFEVLFKDIMLHIIKIWNNILYQKTFIQQQLIVDYG